MFSVIFFVKNSVYSREKVAQKRPQAFLSHKL